MRFCKYSTQNVNIKGKLRKSSRFVNMIDSKQILDRAKAALNISSDVRLAEILGVSKSTLSNWKARNSIDYAILFTKCKQINLDWLITGDGNPEKEPTSSVAVKEEFSLRTDRKIESQDIPLYDMSAAAGLVAIFNENNVRPEDHLRIPNLPMVDGAIYVRGESMVPLLKSGDIIIYKKLELSLDSILWGQIYLLSFIAGGDTFTVVKYVQKSDQPGYIRLVSHNDLFQPKDIPLNSIQALAIVKASITFHTIE